MRCTSTLLTKWCNIPGKYVIICSKKFLNICILWFVSCVSGLYQNIYISDTFRVLCTRMIIKALFTTEKNRKELTNPIYNRGIDKLIIEDPYRLVCCIYNHVYEEYLMTCRIKWKKGDSCLIYFCVFYILLSAFLTVNCKNVYIYKQFVTWESWINSLFEIYCEVI